MLAEAGAMSKMIMAVLGHPSRSVSILMTALLMPRRYWPGQDHDETSAEDQFKMQGRVAVSSERSARQAPSLAAALANAERLQKSARGPRDPRLHSPT
jgi:hypothetical protein